MKNVSSKAMYLAFIALAVCVSARAQSIRVEGGPGQAGLAFKVGEGGQSTFMYEVNVESPMIKGAPYSAKAVTTQTQTLADGNHIKRTSEVELARDSEGRTRREQSLTNLGPWETNAKGSIVVISDPVAHVRYEIAPEGGAQIARKMSMFDRTREPLARAKMEADTAQRDGHAAGFSVKTDTVAGPTDNFIVVSDGEMMVRQKKELAAAREGIVVRDDPKVEDLGQQTIEGVTARGTRRTITIPAGQVGNELPINIVNESWYSPELRMTILSKRSDPRMGETEFRLTNIQRSEPGPSLFQVPAGYEVRDLTQHREF